MSDMTSTSLLADRQN